MLAFAATIVALAGGAATDGTLHAPWRLTGISADERTLHLVYRGGGCLHDDGVPVVDTSNPAAVRVTVRQTETTGPYVVCTKELRFLPLDVPLDAPLNGRRVTGGPPFTETSPADTMPRVIGLRRVDAQRALRGQGLRVARVFGRRRGVIHGQDPAPGRPVRRRAVVLAAGPFDPGARLSISIGGGQTIESVLHHGLRFRFDLNPKVEKAISARIDCGGQDAGLLERPTSRAHGHPGVPVQNIGVRRAMRKRDAITCRLAALTYPADLRNEADWLLFRYAKITLRHAGAGARPVDPGSR